jgi:glyoxylase-like metal-dependent hydrolase (beta-lactamase superfamily II)
MRPQRIVERVYLIGGPELTDERDCLVYLVDLEELVLIDSGAGESFSGLIRNIEALGLDPVRISTVVLTHCHIDHIGGAPRFREAFGSKIAIHRLDVPPVEQGDPERTASSWYGLAFPPTPVDVMMEGEVWKLDFPGGPLTCLHTPGHTPGSIAVYLDTTEGRVLFAQDVHGPFMAAFGSDLAAWKGSMADLLSLRADVLCEGHHGVFRPRERATAFIREFLKTYGFS